MAIKLVNKYPASESDIFIPGNKTVFGLRSETSDVSLASIRALHGVTGFAHRAYKPEFDKILASKNLSVGLETTERRRPTNIEASRTIVSDSLVITKNSNNVGDISIYEITAPLKFGKPALGYIKFRTNLSWSTFSPDWCNLSLMTAPYFGLEHSGYNTGVFGFLRKTAPTTGTLVVGGPLQNFSTARPGQTELATLNWASYPDNTAIELWFYFNPDGYSPLNDLRIEVWKRVNGVDAAPVFLQYFDLLTLGNFTSSSSINSNYRKAPSETVTLYIGNAGLTGDELTIDDWALFTDFRVAIRDGDPFPKHQTIILPDSPILYEAKANNKPNKDFPSRWTTLDVTGSAVPTTVLSYQPGRVSEAQSIKFTKDSSLISGFEKEEPRIAQLTDGVMIEALVSGDVTDTGAQNVFGFGIGIEDSDKLYQVCAVNTASYKTFGVTKDLGDVQDLDNYYLPMDGASVRNIDWRAFKFIRLVMDRYRNFVDLYLEDSKILSIPLPDTFPTSRTALGRFIFGQLIQSDFSGSFNVSFIRALQRYKAWEAEDNLNPVASPVSISGPFVLNASGTGSTTNSATEMAIAKTSFATPSSIRSYSIPDDFSEFKGALIDATFKCSTHTDSTGSVNPTSGYTGSGIKIEFGNKALMLGLFSCGVLGKRVGIIPGSGSIDDIINQTALGRIFSSPINWSGYENYRVQIIPYKEISVWIGSKITKPDIVIPWRNTVDGFDLPLLTSTPNLSFGHFDENEASTTEWKNVRWGISNGYDIAISQDYPDELQPSHFGGRAHTLIEFDE